jgi:hypothetical protein
MPDDPRVEAVAKAMYETPAPWMRHDPNWADAPEVTRESWRRDAERVVGAVDATRAMQVGPTPDFTEEDSRG